MNTVDCEREAIHSPGTIQPHGVLLALSEPDYTILHVSGSAAEHLGRSAESLLGLTLSEVLGDEQVRRVRRVLNIDPRRPVHPLGMELRVHGAACGAFNAILHRHDGLVFIELEPISPSQRPAAALFFALRGAALRIHDALSLEEACRISVEEVAQHTGFDRVMIYRFDADWSGEVIAEARSEDLPPYLGLHFPASDIPAQARRLYALNWVRIIPDVAYQPSAIVPPQNVLRGGALDLTFSVLRSVSPMHLAYLRDMGVRASMSISILREGALWGLIACHHRAPRDRGD